MGIDAEMFVKIKGQPHLTEKDLKVLRARIGDAFGPSKFLIYSDKNCCKHSLEEVQEIGQDSADEEEATIRPAPGEQFIQVSLYTRYYGKDYERGDFPFIYTVSLWLEANLPNAEVWYGGDSSGVLFRPFSGTYREELLQHFLKVGHTPYTGCFQQSLGTEDTWAVPPLCLHPLCGRNMNRHGFGRDYASFTCVSCGRKYLTKDQGKTWLSGKNFGGIDSEVDKIYDAALGVWKDHKKAEACRS